MSQSNTLRTHFVPIEETDFDWDSIIMEKPIKNKKFKCSFPKVFVENEGGHKRRCLLNWQSKTYVACHIVTNMKKRKEKNVEDIIGLQVNYPMTSFETVKKRTEEEEETRERLDRIVHIIGVSLQKFYNDKDIADGMPELSKYKKKVLKDEPGDLVKPPYTKSKKKDNSGDVDESKPLYVYINFKTSGSGSKLRSHTVFKGRKRNETYEDYLWDNEPNRACARISLRWEGIYFGGHGTNDFIASARFVVQSIKLSKPMLEFEPVQDEEDVFGESDYEDDKEEEEEEEKEETFSTGGDVHSMLEEEEEKKKQKEKKRQPVPAKHKKK